MFDDPARDAWQRPNEVMAALELLPDMVVADVGAGTGYFAALVVNVWHHIGERVRYARELSAALRPGGKLFIVEFTIAADCGPPAHLRLAPQALKAVR